MACAAVCANAPTRSLWPMHHGRRQAGRVHTVLRSKEFPLDTTCRKSTRDKEHQMNNPTTRRRFVKITPFAGLALLAACSPKAEPPAASPAAAQAPATAGEKLPMLEKDNRQAVALGYVEDATQADTTKFKNYVAGNTCSNCQLYQGKAGDAAGGCTLFPGKSVAAKGWCTSWVKKV